MDKTNNISDQMREVLKIKTCQIVKGDIMASTNEKVIGIWPGARYMGGRLDMKKVTVHLEYTKKDGTKGIRVGQWGNHTMVKVHRDSTSK